MAKKSGNSPVTIKTIRWMWRLFGIFVAALFVLFILIYNGIIGYMPPIEELKNPTDSFASTIFSADGEEMGRYYISKGNRVYVDFDQMSYYLTDALVATEDSRFESHSGIDARALMRAVIKRVILRQKAAGGGSTITQQLAKQLYSPKSNSIFERALQKPIEWVIAMKLERFYTKDEIIKMYFNQFDFLNNAVGIKSAAYVYFGKDPRDLNIQESAMLVGMCKNPSLYNPLRHEERTKARRNVVFEQMEKAGKITRQECDSLKQLPIELAYHRVDHNDGLAPYFREELRRIMTAKKPERSDYPDWNYQYYVDDSVAWETNPLYGWCQKNRKPNGDNYDIYTDGLKIYTTIDSRMQTYAENAVKKHLGGYLQPAFTRERRGTKNPYTNNTAELSSKAKQNLIKHAIRQSARYRALQAAKMSEEEIMANFNKPIEMHLFSYSGEIDTLMSPMDSLLYVKTYLRCGVLSMDPVTGHVKAYVGGPSFKFFKYDMAGRGRRQIGSTVKPFVYSKAVQDYGLTPCSVRPGGSPNVHWYNDVWNPKGVGGTMTLKSALTHSTNSISAGFMKGTSPNWIEEQGYEVFSPKELASWMHSFGITSKLDPVPALSLGACEISLLEMVSAYTAFANGGMRVAPIFVSRITDNQGNVLAEFSPQQTEVLNEDTYYKMVSMLTSVVDSGTGARLRGSYGIKAEMGGKTGTTNYNADGWFMGFTPELVTGVWVGGDERYIHFNTMAYGQGAAMALPVYGIYMKNVYGDNALPYSEKVKFHFPPSYDPCYSELGHYYNGPSGGNDEGGGEPEAIEGLF